jgi:hypothetical protein
MTVFFLICTLSSSFSLWHERIARLQRPSLLLWRWWCGGSRRRETVVEENSKSKRAASGPNHDSHSQRRGPRVPSRKPAIHHSDIKKSLQVHLQRNLRAMMQCKRDLAKRAVCQLVTCKWYLSCPEGLPSLNFAHFKSRMQLIIHPGATPPGSSSSPLRS